MSSRHFSMKAAYQGSRTLASTPWTSSRGFASIIQRAQTSTGLETICRNPRWLRHSCDPRTASQRRSARSIFTGDIQASDSKLPPNYASSRVPVLIDGKEVDFSSLLLRDMCQCPACVHTSTNQKLYSTADIPSNIEVNSIRSSIDKPDSISLRWTSDAPGFDETHETILSLDVLRDLQDIGAASGPFQGSLEQQVLWGAAEIEPSDTKFADYLGDDRAVYQVMRQLRTHGLVFITEIPHLEDALVKIATRIGPMKDTFYGYTWDVRTVPSAINAAYTSADLGFHTDLLYFQTPPHIQLLHCLQSSSSGGASVFADAFKSAEELFTTDPDTFNTLASMPVNYQYNHPNDNLYHTTKTVFELRPLKIDDTIYSTLTEYLAAWKQKQAEGVPLPNIDMKDCLEKVNWGPPFLAPFSLHQQSAQPSFPSAAPSETLNQKIDRWHAAAKKFSALLHRPEFLHERLMKPGECVLFDNTRVLHARRSFDADDVGKARWLKGGYVDKDPYLSKLRVLKARFESDQTA